MEASAHNELEKLHDLDNKLIGILDTTADILESLSHVDSPSAAQYFINKKPEEFSVLLQTVRQMFGEAIENAPKPGIPYYDPKPLQERLNTDTMMLEQDQ